MNEKASFIGSIFFPSRCCCCGSLTENRELICDKCLPLLPRIPENCCKKCGEAAGKCECSRIPAVFSGIAVPFYNGGSAKAGVYALKMNGAKSNALFFGNCMAKRFSAVFPDVKPDFVVPVPMSRQRRKSAEFNHAAELAKVVSRALKIPYRGRVLRRTDTPSPAQHTLNYAERINGVKELYFCDENLKGETVLLIDDIRTTAATFNACARQLLLGGAKEVYCAAALLTERKTERI